MLTFLIIVFLIGTITSLMKHYLAPKLTTSANIEKISARNPNLPQIGLKATNQLKYLFSLFILVHLAGLGLLAFLLGEKQVISWNNISGLSLYISGLIIINIIVKFFIK